MNEKNESVDIAEAQRKFEFDLAKQHIVQALKTISVESEWLFQTMPKDKETIEFLDSVKGMTEVIAQRYEGVYKYIKNYNSEKESQSAKNFIKNIKDSRE